MKIRYLIFGLVFACLGLTSFSSATDYTCNEAFTLTGDSLFTINSLSFGEDKTSFEILDHDENIYFHFDMMFRNDNYYGTIIKDLSFVLGPSEDYWIGCQDSNASFSVVPFVSQSCQDCSLLSGDLATCQGSLGACLEDNTSLENMNSSLQDQLSQCLANSNACDPEEDEDCYTGAYQLFHLFRQNQGSDFSLPITNNIFLPSGLRAFNDSGSVALAPLSPNDYSLDRESGEILNDLVIKIFYYLAVLLSVMALAYYIKKFLSFTLFPKKD